MAIGTTAAIIGSSVLGAAGAAASANSQKKAAQSAANASQQASDASIAEQRRQYDLSRQDQMPWLTTGTSALNTLAGLYNLNTHQPVQNQPSTSAPLLNMYGGLGNYLPYSDQMQMYGDNGSGIGTAQYGTAQPVADATQPPAQSTGGNLSSFFESPDYQFRMNESMRALNARNSALGIQDSGAAQKSAIQQAGNLASGEFNNYANRLASLAGVGQTAAQNTAALGSNMATNIGNTLTANASNLASSYQNKANAQTNLYGSLANLGGGILGYYGGTR